MAGIALPSEEALVQKIGLEIADGVFGRPGKGSAQELMRSTGAYLADVEYDCLRFQRQIGALERRHVGKTYGVLLDQGPPVPIDLGWYREWQERPLIVATSDVAVFPEGMQLAKISIADCRTGFMKGLLPFLHTRISAKRAGGDPRIAFTVHTKRDDGRVHYARAYFVSYRNVFGAPTSPVKGALPPGMYSFGVDYDGGPLMMDTATYWIPHVKAARLPF